MQTVIPFSIPIHLNGRCGSWKYTNGSSDILMLVSGERCFFWGAQNHVVTTSTSRGYAKHTGLYTINLNECA